MSKFHMILLSLLLFCVAMAAQDSLVVDPPTWDFGTVMDNVLVRQVFTIKNESKQSVRLSTLPSTCGCMLAKPEPEVVEAGKEAKFYVVFDPKGRRGLFRWDAKIQTDLPDKSILTIPLQAYVLLDGVISERIANFRVFKKGEESKITLWMACNKKRDFQIKSIVCDIPGFTIQKEEMEVEGFYPGNQRGYRIDIQAQKDIAHGRSNGKIYIETDIPGSEKIDVLVYAYVVGDITVVPDYLSFGVLSRGDKRLKKVSISHNESKNFKVTNVSSTLPFLSTRLETSQAGQYYYLHVTAEASENVTFGEFRGLITIETDCPGHDKINVTVQGFVKPASVKK